MRLVLDWLESCRSYATVLVGDLNVYFPDEQIHHMLKTAGFASAYAEVHSKDAITCPTPLEAPTIVPGSSVEQACDFVLIRPSADGTVKLVATAAELSGNISAAGDATLYPSDHYAVLATLDVRCSRD
eukprot:gnl/TRDRNA2_/TRDRNA2_133465_c0_seq1.p1 gnl/TRDRNA2_/TRDRNA2_133465_c0~~gnl/TRDRNA2_/TRDRNA2_133465_c0_seq1.p1  ORF type:complete len:128 (+),score=9.57 gnl/TRDRNA2_/TRDRNA2_133465_c0_seq1:2-385(+)